MTKFILKINLSLETFRLSKHFFVVLQLVFKDFSKDLVKSE